MQFVELFIQMAIACRQKLKGLASLTFNIEDVSALKELTGSLEILLDKFTAFQMIDEKETQHKHQTTRYLPRNNLKLLEITSHYMCGPRKNDFKTGWENFHP